MSNVQVPEVLFLRPTIDPAEPACTATLPNVASPRRSVRDVVANLRPSHPTSADITIQTTARELRPQPAAGQGAAPIQRTPSLTDEPLVAAATTSATQPNRVTRPWPQLIERLASENQVAWSALLARIPANAVVGCLGLHPHVGTTTVAATMALCRSEFAVGRDALRSSGRHRPHDPALHPATRRTVSQERHVAFSSTTAQPEQACEPATDPRMRWRVDPPHSLNSPQFLIDANIDRPALATRLEIEADGTWPEWTTHAIAPTQSTEFSAAELDLPGTPDLKIWPLSCALVPTTQDSRRPSAASTPTDSIRYYLPPQAAGPILQCLTNLITELQRQGSGVVLDLGHLPLWQRLMWLPTLGKLVQHLILVVPANPDPRDVSRAYWQLQDYGLTSCQLIENQRPDHPRS